MFISGDEAKARLGSNNNLVNKIQPGPHESDSSSHVDIPLDVPEVPADGTPEEPADTSTQSTKPTDEEAAAIARAILRGEKPPRRKRTLDNDTRATVAVAAQLTSQSQAARMFGVPQPSAHSYLRHKNTNSDPDGKNAALGPLIEERLGEVRDLAFEKLLKSLDLMNDDMFKTVKNAKDASIVASNLSRIVEKTLPKDQEKEKTVHFHVYTPPQLNVNQYDVIEVSPTHVE